MKASWREKNSLQLYSTVEIHTHTHIHMNISLSRYVSRLKCKKGPHWELNPGPLAIKARFSQSENHTTRPYGHNLFSAAKTHVYKYLDYKFSCRHRAGSCGRRESKFLSTRSSECASAALGFGSLTLLTA